MTIPTLPPEPATCPLCGVSTHRQAMSQHGVDFYKYTKHDAPCGKPCLQGGVPGSVYKSAAFHGKTCAACANKKLAEVNETLINALPNLKADA